MNSQLAEKIAETWPQKIEVEETTSYWQLDSWMQLTTTVHKKLIAEEDNMKTKLLTKYPFKNVNFFHITSIYKLF